MTYAEMNKDYPVRFSIYDTLPGIEEYIPPEKPSDSTREFGPEDIFVAPRKNKSHIIIYQVSDDYYYEMTFLSFLIKFCNWQTFSAHTAAMYEAVKQVVRSTCFGPVYPFPSNK